MHLCYYIKFKSWLDMSVHMIRVSILAYHTINTEMSFLSWAHSYNQTLIQRNITKYYNMVRAPYFDKNGTKKGAWSKEEDQRLIAHIERHGHPNWRQLPRVAGMKFCYKC